MTGALTAVWPLSGFGDEVDPDPAVQAAVLLALGGRFAYVDDRPQLDAEGAGVGRGPEERILRCRPPGLAVRVLQRQ